MQTVLTSLIVLVAVGYLLRMYWPHMFRKQPVSVVGAQDAVRSGCGGCHSCGGCS